MVEYQRLGIMVITNINYINYHKIKYQILTIQLNSSLFLAPSVCINLPTLIASMIEGTPIKLLGDLVFI